MNPNAQAAFPKTRFRRARQSAQTRALIRENRVSVEDLIWPVFICDCLLYTSPSPRDATLSRMPSSA